MTRSRHIIALKVGRATWKLFGSDGTLLVVATNDERIAAEDRYCWLYSPAMSERMIRVALECEFPDVNFVLQFRDAPQA